MAADALYMLKAAVAIKDCELGVCDVDSDCNVSVHDALLTLGNSLMGQGEISCNPTCAEAYTCGRSVAPRCGGSCPSGHQCMYEGNIDFSAASTRHRDRDSDSDDGNGRDHNRRGDRERHHDRDRDSDRDSDSAVAGNDPGFGTECYCVPVEDPAVDPTPPAPSNPSTTTTLPEPSSTTTTSSTTLSTTTTTLGANADRGMQTYKDECQICHKAGSFDTNGFAPDLTNKIRKLRTNISSLTGAHPNNLQFTQQQIDDLKEFLRGL